MKKLIYSKAFWYVLINVVIIGCVVGSCLFSAFVYKEVPYNYRHIFDNLHDYIIYEHSITLGLGILCALVGNIGLAIKTKE